MSFPDFSHFTITDSCVAQSHYRSSEQHDIKNKEKFRYYKCEGGRNKNYYNCPMINNPHTFFSCKPAINCMHHHTDYLPSTNYKITVNKSHIVFHQADYGANNNQCNTYYQVCFLKTFHNFSFFPFRKSNTCSLNQLVKYFMSVYLKIFIRELINQLSSALIIVSKVLSACRPSFLIPLIVSTNVFTFLSLLSPSTSSSLFNN